MGTTRDFCHDSTSSMVNNGAKRKTFPGRSFLTATFDPDIVPGGVVEVGAHLVVPGDLCDGSPNGVAN